ncbi:hypothetical protein CMO90_04430 [Candidatus Woesearchaeota archaeon]|nr:hypothetical protein [Candidatus Woesearchaeota archaeon]
MYSIKMKNKFNTTYWNKATRKGHYLDDIYGKYKGEDIKQLIEKWVPDIDKKRILKTDCFEEAYGHDQILFNIAKENGEVYGIDISNEVIEKAKERQKEFKTKKRTFICCDTKKLSFEDNFFDVIISNSSHDHFPKKELPAAIRELKRVLKKNGVLILTMHNKHNQIFYFACQFGKLTGLIPYYTTFFTKKETKKLVGEEGFKVEYITTYFHAINQSHKIVKFLRKIKSKKIDRSIKNSVKLFKKIGKTKMNHYLGWFIALKCIKK